MLVICMVKWPAFERFFSLSFSCIFVTFLLLFFSLILNYSKFPIIMYSSSDNFRIIVLLLICFWTQYSHFVPTAINVAIKELISVATPGQVDWKYLDCDKQSTKSAILMNLESGMVASEDIAKQVSTYGERYGCLQGSYLSFIARAMTLLPSMSQATIQLALSSSENQNCFPVLNSTSIFSSSLKIGSLGAFIVNKKLLIPLPRQGTYYSDIASED